MTGFAGSTQTGTLTVMSLKGNDGLGLDYYFLSLRLLT